MTVFDNDEIKRKAEAGDPAAIRALIATVDKLETEVLELEEALAVERDEHRYRQRGIA